jgi:predicted transport protein
VTKRDATTATWACPKCKRRFTRKNQRHACGTGKGTDVVRNRPPEVVAAYAALEKFAKALGEVELVTRERYVLFRSKKIFADAVIMTDAVRLAIHLPQKIDSDLFIKVVADRRHVTHVTKLRNASTLKALMPLLKQAYEHSLKR